MNANLDQQLTLDDLARVARLSRSRMICLFKAEKGVSPGQYIKSLRIRRGRELLERTSLGVKEIAVRVGLDQNHFSREFKKTRRDDTSSAQMKTSKQRGWFSSKGSVLLICCALIVGAGSSPRGFLEELANAGKPPAPQLETVVVGEGLRLEVLEVKHLGRYVFDVVIKNGYQKDITAIAAYVGGDKKMSVRRDYIYAENEDGQKLAPGATDTLTYALTPSLGAPQVVLSAVVFSDGTSRGDRSEVAEILDKRVGMKIQLNRINPYLARLAKVKDTNLRSELARVRSVADALPIDPGDGSPMSEALEYGLRHGQAFVLEYLSRLDATLATDRVESFYQDGELHTIPHTGVEDFRRYHFPKVWKRLMSLAERL